MVFLKKQLATIISAGVLLAAPSILFAFDALDDRQLDSVVAGRQVEEPQGPLATIPFRTITNNGTMLDGEAIIMPPEANYSTASGMLMIRDNAQGSLKSFININAVNAPVQILLNLNVNIESRVGTLKQFNVQGTLN